MGKNGIPLKNVQKAFSNAIKRRDGRCMVRDYESCYGSLECSHFFTQGANPSLMFYPPNAYAQCRKHHFNHHNKKDLFYFQWITSFHNDDFCKMQNLCHRYIRYSDELKRKIINLCNQDKLGELSRLIEKELCYDV